MNQTDKMKIKQPYLLPLLMLLGFIANAQQSKISSLAISNKSSFNYKDRVIAIPWQKVVESYPSIDTANLKIVDAVSKKEIAYQLESAGETEVQNLLVQVSIKANASSRLLLQKGKHAPFIIKTYGRFVPERKQDFAWENDRIAFRMYGKELEKTPSENGYGMDVWVKRTTRMILNERYKRGDYHVDHGDGLDYYNVGFSLGAGSCMPYVKDSIYYSKNYTSWKVLDNGTLRTTFQLGYDAWDVAGKKITAIKTISLDAGSQLNKVSVDYTYDGDENLPMVIGIIKRPEAGVGLLDEQKGILGYWEPTHGDDGTTGIGCIIPSTIKNMLVNGKQLLAISEMKKGSSFVYYTGAVWNKAGIITHAGQWFQYLQMQQQQLVNDGITINF